MSQQPSKEDGIRVKVIDKPGPIVCSFPGGLPAVVSDEPPTFVLRPSKDKDHTITLMGKDATCLYTAEAELNNSNNKRKERSTHLCVGIYDKVTKTLTLQKAAADGYVFSMAQSVPAYEMEQTMQQSSMAAADIRKSLFEDFGSAKKRKALRSQEANRVNVESVIGAGSLMVDHFMKGEAMSSSNRAALEKARHETDHHRDEGAAAEEWRRSFLPTFDKDTDRPYKVYNAKDMAGPMAWTELERTVVACMKRNDVIAALTHSDTSDRPDNAWSAVVVEAMRKLPKDSADKVQFYVKASLLNHWTALYRKLGSKRNFPGPSGDMRRYLGVPTDVAQRFISMFATVITSEDDRGTFVMSKANKDRCCLHLLLLYLMVDGKNDMKSDSIPTFAAEIKMDMKEASQLLRLAGCSVYKKPGTSQLVVKLGVPLVFPSIKKRTANAKAKR
jgi:DNA-directed RNA polymerase I subunit RPA49